MKFIQQLLGMPAGDEASIQGVAFRLAPLIAPLLIAIIAILLVVLSWTAYRSTPADVSAGRRRFMLCMRMLFFIMLLGLLLRPVLQLQMEREKQRTLAVLVDGSASMAIADMDGSTRAAAVEGILNDPQLDLLEQLGAQANVVRYSFGAALADADLAANAEAPETALGDVLSETLRRHSAEDLAGILLLSDGVSNEGRTPLSAANALAERGVRIMSYGVGATDSADIAVEALDLPTVALAKDAVPVTVRLRHRGLPGQRARVIVTMAGARAGEKEFELSASGEQEVTIPVIPNTPGEFEIEARVELADESGGTVEILAENNARAQSIRILDSQIRVLMVESSPRWEFKYIQAMLLRERRVKLDCFLADVDPAVTRTPGTPYLGDFPERREDLFGYDLILFGDTDPRDLPANAVANIAAFVSDGGGSLAILAGKRFTPQAYRNTEFERLLPVELSATQLGADRSTATRPLRLQLTAAGASENFLSLEEDPARAQARWDTLPPIYWTAKIERAKPAAETYLTHPIGNAPVVALQRYGAGEVLWIGTDNTWRWRKNTGDLYHTRFWGQVVQRMAGRRLATGSRRSDLRSDRSVVRSGERFTVFARLLDGSFQARKDETIVATLEGRGDNAAGPRQISLRAVPGSPGMYRAEFPAGTPGRYQLAVSDDPAGAIDLQVRGADREMARTAMDEQGLRALAEQTGGAFLYPQDLERIAEIADLKPSKISLTREAELWNSPLYFLLLLLPLALEWFTRKFNELK